MTVYELIQELASFSPDTEVLVSFESTDACINCLNCGEEIEIDGDDVTAREFAVNKIGHRIYIEAEE